MNRIPKIVSYQFSPLGKADLAQYQRFSVTDTIQHQDGGLLGGWGTNMATLKDHWEEEPDK